MKLFDLHCDTALMAYLSGQTMQSNDLHIAFDRIDGYEEYTQVLAVFSQHKLSEEEAYEQFLAVCDYIEGQKPFPGNFHYILGVEGAKLLAGKLERLDELYRRGVRILTLVWADSCCIGGAHNTDEGLTEFGFRVVKRCFELGIVPDISHASDQMVWQVAEIAHEHGKPFIASHSDYRALRDLPRNMTDGMLVAIAKSGGLAGINLCPFHLSEPNGDGRSVATIDGVLRHILHAREVLASLGEEGKGVLCLGCDLDGTDLPKGIEGVQDLHKIADAMRNAGIAEDEINDIFYRNAKRFFDRNHIDVQK